MQQVANFCTIEGHKNKQIQFICFNAKCKLQRALCFLCQQDHLSHQPDMKELDELNGFMPPKKLEFLKIIQRLDQISNYFNSSVSSLIKILNEQYQPPNNLNNIGNQQLGQIITKMLHYEDTERLIKDRLENIFQNILKEIRKTCQDLGPDEDKQCYQLIQQKRWQEARANIDKQLIKNPKNTFLLLGKGNRLIFFQGIHQLMKIYLLMLKKFTIKFWQLTLIIHGQQQKNKKQEKNQVELCELFIQKISPVSYYQSQLQMSQIQSDINYKMEQLEIGVVLFIASLSFFFLGYLWAKNASKFQYDSLGSEEDDSQNIEQVTRDFKKKEEQYIKQIQDLRKQLGLGASNNKNTDL